MFNLVLEIMLREGILSIYKKFNKFKLIIIIFLAQTKISHNI